MNNRKKRLTEVYNYVRRHYPVHTQGDFAQVVVYSRPVISSALNGNEEYLSDKFFTNICNAFPNVFNLDYLLHGDGNLLTTREDSYLSSREDYFPSVAKEPDMLPSLPQWADTLISILSSQIKENEALNREIRQSISEVNALRSDLQKLIEKITQKS